MFEIYYTGAGNSIREQQDPTLSLGGFISESLVPNDFDGAIFSSIQGQSTNDSLVLGLINKAVTTSTTITIVDRFNSDVKFLGGAIFMILDTCGIYKTEKLPNRNSKPRTVQLVDFTSVNSYLEVEFDNELVAGINLTIDDDATEVLNITTTNNKPIVDQIVDSFDGNQSYYARKVFDYDNKVYKVFVYKEDLINFGTISNDSNLIITKSNAVVNQISLGALSELDQYIALFIVRDFKLFNKNVKEKQDCERLFTEFTEGVSSDQNREYSIRIDYETS